MSLQTIAKYGKSRNFKMQTLTVFTPTYNRQDMLGRVYDSLKEQTNKDFEWLIVDDGSTDGTEDVVKGFKKEKEIKIK